MKVVLVNPSDTAFGTAVITPRWLYVLAAATPASAGDPVLVDETLERLDPAQVERGDVVGISIHTANALRGYEIGRMARERGAHVIFGGIHATLYPEESQQLGSASAVVTGDGDIVWASVVNDCINGRLRPIYAGGRVDGDQLISGRWDLIPRSRYMWASVQTVRGCPKHCSFCSVWRTDGQRPRQRASEAVVQEVVELRRLGFRYMTLSDDNFYPVTLTDLALARRNNPARFAELQQMRDDRLRLMAQLAQLPSDTCFFTQITMEAAEDPEFLDAMRAAHIRGALVGVESVTPEGLKDVYKDFNYAGEQLVERLRTFREHGVNVLGSFIFGLPSDRPETFHATAEVAQRAEVAFAQFVMLTPFPGTVDFDRWEKKMGDNVVQIEGVPITRRWLIPYGSRPKLYHEHPVMSAEEVRSRTQAVWDEFYSMPNIWRRSRFIKSVRGRVTFVLISKIYRQMYADTGIASDSARQAWGARWARWLARPCQKLFSAPPMPDLQVPAVDVTGAGRETNLAYPA
jgi:radical SAM superfamily enzyme YgiQ (UPF0313 family)